jgi:hypothetical protein
MGAPRRLRCGKIGLTYAAKVYVQGSYVGILFQGVNSADKISVAKTDALFDMLP